MANLHELVTYAESNPDDWEARLQLAQAYKELGMTDEAINALRGNPKAPITMAQSRLVKQLRSELDPEGKVDMSEPVHPVSGKVMERMDAGAVGGVGEEAVRVVEEGQDGSHSAPVEPGGEGHHGERAIVLAGEVDPNAIRPHERDPDTAQKVSALTVAIIVHVAIALILGFVVMSLPPVNPPQIVATAYTPESDEQIEQVQIRKKSQATAASSASKPTMAISSMASSPIAIPDFDDSQSMDVTLGVTAQEVGTGMSFDKGDGDASTVNFFGIRSSGSRIVFVIEAARFMLTDRKGGIPAFTKVKEEIAQMLAGMNRQTAFNIVIYEGKKIATFKDELVAATPSNIRQAVEWFEPVNKEFEKIGILEGFTSKPVQSGIEPIPVDDLIHYIKAMQRALEMDVNTMFVLTSGWIHHHKPMEQREYDKWMRKQDWGKKEEEEWLDALVKAKAWLSKENATRKEKGVPQRVIRDWHEIVAEILPNVRRKPGPSYTMEEVEDQIKNSVSMYYRGKGKERPKINIVWFIGQDEEVSPSVQAHFENIAKRNRGKQRVLEGMAGLQNVTSGP
jgi:hypothetical protein